jgi:hypothetical protein
LPVPLTVDVQAEVWLVEIVVGEQLTATEVIVGSGPPLPPQPMTDANRQLRRARFKLRTNMATYLPKNPRS